jgi:hypothetical protein
LSKEAGVAFLQEQALQKIEDILQLELTNLRVIHLQGLCAGSDIPEFNSAIR